MTFDRKIFAIEKYFFCIDFKSGEDTSRLLSDRILLEKKTRSHLNQIRHLKYAII
jgi:hypothetical protein